MVELGFDAAHPSIVSAVAADNRSPPRMVELDFADAEASRAVGVDPPVEAMIPAFDNIDVGALFINSLRLPLEESLLHMPPHRRGVRQEPASLVPRRSDKDRLAAKAPFRDPNLEKQAKRVLV